MQLTWRMESDMLDHHCQAGAMVYIIYALDLGVYVSIDTYSTLYHRLSTLQLSMPIQYSFITERSLDIGGIL